MKILRNKPATYIVKETDQLECMIESEGVQYKLQFDNVGQLKSTADVLMRMIERYEYIKGMEDFNNNNGGE